MDMAIFEHFFKLFCNLFLFFKILKRLFFRLFDPFSTTKRLKTDSRFDYLTVLKTTKAPEANLNSICLVFVHVYIRITVLMSRMFFYI